MLKRVIEDGPLPSLSELPTVSARPRAPGVMVPGRNCWRVEQAARASVLIDAEPYFAHLDSALRRARRSILIVGWDFDGKIKLRPGADEPELGALLRSLLDDAPELEIRVLVWSVAVVHAPGAPLPLILGADWMDHPRLTVKLDAAHPFYGAHHQKIVAIDDTIAFAGGMDLTVRRWDCRDHAPDDPRRVSPDGKSYGPVHDIQAVVDGPAARALGDLARERWRIATGETLPPCGERDPIWPDGLEPHFEDEVVGIARTVPDWGGNRPVREAAELTADALRAARQSIYIEAQYLTARFVREILADHLADPHGPEIVVVMTFCARGFFERLVMGINGERLIRYLRRRDPHDRFRVYYPAIPGSTDQCPIHVHAKLLIVDDRFIRVGSSNLNNRSVGLDTECDIGIEATRPETADRIAAVRDQLLAEHLDVEPEEVRAAHDAEASLIRAIDRLNVNPRGLRLSPAFHSEGATRSMPGTFLLDPGNPFSPLAALRRWRRR